MSQEAFPQLPPEAQQHIAAVPAELQQKLEGQLLGLSHIDLHTSHDTRFDGIEHKAIPKTELNEAHKPAIDTVSLQMGLASEALGKAHAALAERGLTGDQMTHEALYMAARDALLGQAVAEKQAGNPEKTLQTLETILVLESLSDSGRNSRDNKEELVRQVVSNGLATELVQASHDSFGLVAVVSHSRRDTHALVPLTTTGRKNAELLHAASKLDFNDDFSEVAQRADDTVVDTTHFASAELMALAKNFSGAEGDPAQGKQMIEAALAKLYVNDSTNPKDAAEILIAAETVSADKLAETLVKLREQRQVGSPTYRINSFETGLLDETIVILTKAGNTRLASALMSSSSYEMKSLSFVLERTDEPPDSATALLGQMEGLHDEKQKALVASLTANGVNEALSMHIIDSAVDPDSASGVSAEFWKTYDALPYDISKQLLEASDDLARNAVMITALEQYGLFEQADSILRQLKKIEAPEKQASFIESLKAAYVLVDEAVEAGTFYDGHQMKSWLCDFQDPQAALLAGQRLFGDKFEYQRGNFSNLVGDIYARSGPMEFTEATISQIEQMKAFTDSIGLAADYLVDSTRRMRSMEDPETYVRETTAAWMIAKSVVEHDAGAFFAISSSEHPLSLAHGFVAVESLLAGKPQDFITSVHSQIEKAGNPAAYGLMLVHAEAEFKKHDLTIELVGASKLLELANLKLEGTFSDAEVARFCSDWKINDQFSKSTAEMLHTPRETHSYDRKSGSFPTLESVPELQNRFRELDLPDDIAEQIYATWSTYDAVEHIIYKDKLDRTNMAESVFAQAAKQQEEKLKDQLEAMTDYAEAYGNESLRSVIDIFNINNFERYKPGQLHDQLTRWQAGEISPKNILVSARSDWNSALNRSGRDYASIFKGDDFFAFEAGDPTTLAKIAVAIGDRERLNGRDPKTETVVENFLINGHANPKGLYLGVKDEAILVTDYVKAEKNREKINARENDYSQHLGNKFRLILQACSSAGETIDGRNIARSISEGHNVRVEGSPMTTSGTVIIEPDGSVIFRVSDKDGKSLQIPGTVYDRR